MRRITLLGNLTADAEVKQAADRKAINFSVAVNETYRDKKGNKMEKSFFYNCTIWRDENVNVAQFLTKGTKVLLEGSPEVEVFQTKEGETKAAIKVIVKNLEFAGGGSKKDEGGTQTSMGTNEKHDDLPF